MPNSNPYRTHTTAELNENMIGQTVRVAGHVENIRDHGGVSFLDLRDHYSVVQVVLKKPELLNGIGREYSVSVKGVMEKRDPETYNPKIPTGTFEVNAEEITVLGEVTETLPFEVTTSNAVKEELRLKYRYLDLRNRKMHDNIMLRSKVVSYMRKLMTDLGFTEIQTPILTCSSPEGARDYIIPSRKHKGKFYALPQAPQIYKQLLMASGFDKYFQIAPCFRDEDARADRSPGEFYQLDYEMAYATEEDVFKVGEYVLYNVFETFKKEGTEVSKPPFRRISYKEAMLRFGTDKPDFRNPLRIVDLTEFFSRCNFPAFKGKTVRAIKVDDCAKEPKSFYEKMLDFATSIGMKGLGYVKVDENFKYQGPIDKFIPDELKSELKTLADLTVGSTLFFIADDKSVCPKLAGQIRNELGRRLNLIDTTKFEFCYVNDIPMYELDDDGNLAFTHNPFSMPQGGMDALLHKDPLDVLAYQYDIVVNGVELSSGAVRNHRVDVMRKVFEIVGYGEDVLETKFSSLYNAFKYGAPPHAGMAPGVDRILMLLAGEENIREVIAFPMNSNAEDLLVGAPSEVTEQQLREVHVKLR